MTFLNRKTNYILYTVVKVLVDLIKVPSDLLKGQKDKSQGS